MKATDTKVRTGLDLFSKKWPRKLKGCRLGLLAHPPSVNSRIEHAVDLFIESKNFELKVLMGPQHGIRGETQDNMVEWEGFVDPHTALPVFSLYGHTRKPETAMLNDIDALAIDIQDVGSRYYTFIWTMELCMQACAEMGKSIVVLDRPNPIGGHLTEGTVLDMDYASFVGQRPLPVRHGMTVGEIACYLKNGFYPSLNLHVIPLHGWRRSAWFDETGLPWVLPSPNMPSVDTAAVYPGMCLLEGTNLSEGRGTCKPFEIFGAPFIEPDALAAHLKDFHLPGVFFRPMYFQPTFQKHACALCGGAQIHIINRERFRPFKTGVAVIKAIHDLYPEHFKWKQPPYEYESEKMPVDILAGTDRLRKDIEKGKRLDRMEEWWQEQCREFSGKIRTRHLIYK
jgi:uncharacterized protein YbbC (DUF1343 family)